ncbi:hypothetical protein ACFWOI_49445, partial [Streptomyces sp. NPDC058424]
MSGDWLGKFRRERRALARARRAAWRLEQAEKERDWALGSARAGGVSVRKAAKAAGLSPTQVHQLTKDVSADVLEAVLAELRAAGWPAPEDPDGRDDAELPGRADVGGRLVDEVGWIRQCAERSDHLERKHYPLVVNLRPEADFPDRHPVVVDLPQVAAVLRRIAYDIDELAAPAASRTSTEHVPATIRGRSGAGDWPNRLMLAGRVDRTSRIPFGPFLLAGTLAGVLLGSRCRFRFLRACRAAEPPGHRP